MPPAAADTLLSILPARALLGRLLTLRVALVVGWAAGIAWLHWGLGIRMPLLPMAAVLVLMGAFALSTAWRLRQDVPATQMEFLAHLLADLTAYAVLLYFSGGATNPFVSLMLVPVVIAAISLRPRWTWLLAATASAYYAGLLFVYQPLAVADPLAAYGMHLAGMWFNFLLSAALIAFFVTRMHAALRTRERALAELREKQLRDERIVALGTQAALAAHELATPLATLQTTAHDLAAEFANDPDIGADCRLIERQAQACKAILTRLAARAQDYELARSLNVNGLAEMWFENETDRQICYDSEQEKICDVDSLLFIGASARVVTDVTPIVRLREPARGERVFLFTSADSHDLGDTFKVIAGLPGVIGATDHVVTKPGAEPTQEREAVQIKVSRIVTVSANDPRILDRVHDVMIAGAGDSIAVFDSTEHYLI